MAIVMPEGVDPFAVLGDAKHSAWRTEPDWRRWATRCNPALFAYTYLHHLLSSTETGGVSSFAQHHLDMAAAALQWIRPGAHRDAWVTPRAGAKTTWCGLILPLWALAHGHRGMALQVGDSERQALQHLADLRAELTGNELLRYDFPDLVPVRGRNRADEVVTVGGAAFAARGMDSRALGMNIGGRRPDLFVADDIEPDEANYSPEARDRRLGTLLHKIMPMNEQAALALVGTVTMHGSIMHDVVLAAGGSDRARWLEDARIRPRHYPAITTGPDGAERSYWPTRHALGWLQSIRHTRDFALNYDGRPSRPGEGVLWTPKTWRRLAEPVPVEGRVVFVDVAMSGASLKARHDYTAITIVGRPTTRRDRVIVEYARAWRMTFRDLSLKLADICAANPGIREVHVEVNAFGGEENMRNSVTAPPGVRLVPYRVHESKDYRIKRLLDHYEHERVWHAVRLAEYEDQAERWPQVPHDDLVDVVAAGVEHVLAGARVS